jgi:hypothetical protein
MELSAAGAVEPATNGSLRFEGIVHTVENLLKTKGKVLRIEIGTTVINADYDVRKKYESHRI